MNWLLDKVADSQPLSTDEALRVMRTSHAEIPALLHAANTVRQRSFGNKVRLCAIVNAKSGACQEDCAFCAQSVHHNTDVSTFPLIAGDKISEAYLSACKMPVTHFGIVTSGRALNDTDVGKISEVIRQQKERPVKWCASLGALNRRLLRGLRDAGLQRYHHNLETAESFFSKVCTTHPYAERLSTIRAAKEAGLEVCCGGIFGLGESLEQRVEFALCLADLHVDSIPLNFLVPVQGTKLAQVEPMKPLDILRIIAMFRLICPEAEIKICAGREQHLRSLQSLIFYAGATGMMIGGYLTVAGRPLEEDIRMLNDLQVEYE